MFFYIDTDLHRMLMASNAADRYLRSGVRWVFTIYALPLFVSLALAAFDPVCGMVTFVGLGLVLVLPWIIGRWAPAATAYVPSILLALAAGFASTAALITTQFDATTAMADLDPADRAP